MSDIVKKIKFVYKEYTKLLTFSLFLVFFLCSLIYFQDFLFKKALKVIFLDVGQGDSALIIAPEGSKTLIDAGPDMKTVGRIEDNINFFDKNLENIILTHQDLDHVGGFTQIVKAFNVKDLFVSNKYTEKIDFNSKNYIKEGDFLKTGSIFIQTLSPNDKDLGSTNHTSIVNMIVYGKYRFIFMADSDKEKERSFISKGYFKNSDYYVDILKLGHHGSDTSSSELFLKQIKPEYCIFSVGKGNVYGHPSKSVLDLANKYCLSIYRTDEDGSVSFITDGNDLKIK